MSRLEPVVVLPRSKYGARRQHWLAARRQGITATDAAAILGVDPWTSPLALYVDKLDGTDEARENEAMYWGTALEHVVATEWGKRNRDRNLLVRPTPGLLAHAERPWQLCTLDRYVTDAPRDSETGRLIRVSDPVGVLEVKTTGARHDEAWPADGAPPDRVVAQVMHQLIVTDLHVAHVAVLIGGQRYRQWTIERDPELCAEITRRETEFLARLEHRDPPAPSGHPADEAALDALFTAQEGQAVMLDAVLIDEARALRRQINALEARQQEVDDHIRFKLGDDVTGYVEGESKPAVTWRANDVTRVDLDALRIEHPDLVTQYERTTRVRRLLVKKGPTT